MSIYIDIQYNDTKQNELAIALVNTIVGFIL